MTAVFLRMFHHAPSPVPRNLRYLVFEITARLVFFDVKRIGDHHKNSQVASTDDEQNGVAELDEGKKRNVVSLKQLDENEDEVHVREWQAVAKILEKLVFWFNVLGLSVSYCYCYSVMLTY